MAAMYTPNAWRVCQCRDGQHQPRDWESGRMDEATAKQKRSGHALKVVCGKVLEVPEARR